MSETNINAQIGTVRPINVSLSNFFQKGEKFITFSFTAASDGTNIFTLPSEPKTNGVVVLGINGTLQDQAGGDYSFSGTNLTVDDLETGDKVYGAYAEKL